MSAREPLRDGDRVYYSRTPRDTGTVKFSAVRDGKIRVWVLWDDDCDDDVDPKTWQLDVRIHSREKRPSRREPYARTFAIRVVRVSAKRTTTAHRSRP